MISTKTKRLKQIAISEEHWKALSLLGHTAESFDTVVGRLLEEQERQQQQQQRKEKALV